MVMYTGWARKKFPLMKIHSIKSTSQIGMIQVLVKRRKIEVVFEFSGYFTSTRNIGKFIF